MLRSVQSEIGYRHLFSITMVTLLSALVLYLSLPQSSEAKETAYWNVLFVEGTSQWRPISSTENWQALSKEQQLPARIELRTLDNSQAVIAHGFDKIELEPNSTINVSPEADADSTTAINQLKGKVGYSVQKRKARTFSVTAPYLVAVVKGTSFSVDINEESTQVDVDEGIVSVSNVSDGTTADVTAGMSANVSNNTKGVSTSMTNSSNSTNTGLGISAEGGTSGAGGVEGSNASVGVGVGGIGVGVGVGVSDGGISASAGVGVGGVGASAGVGAGSDGVGASAGASAGGVGADAGVGAGSDGVGASAGASAGGVGADAGVGVGDSGVGADAGVGGADAGVGGIGVGVGIGSDGVGVGVGIGGIGVSVGIGG